MHIPTTDEIILDFISQFNTHPEVEKLFTNGMCYWFAHILRSRFWNYNTEIMIAPIENHFACRIAGNLYDITGRINPDDYVEWYIWRLAAREDDRYTERIYRDCIYKGEQI